MLHKSNQNKCDTFSPLVLTIHWRWDMESHGTLAFAILDAVQGHPNIAQLSFHKLIFPTQYPLAVALALSSYFRKFMRRKMNLHSMMLSASKQWCERQQQPQQHQKTDTKNRPFHFSLWIIVPYKIMDIYAAIIFYHQREIQLLKWKKSVRDTGGGGSLALTDTQKERNK